MLNYLNTTFTFGKQTKDNFITESFNAGLHIHSLIFVPAFPLVWYGLIIHFWLKSRNNMNAARGNTVTSKISSWLYDDENIKNKNFQVSQLRNRVLTCWITKGWRKITWVKFSASPAANTNQILIEGVLQEVIIIMAHPVVVDDELGASPFFLRTLWLTMNNQNSERHAICCDRQQVFPMTVERCGSPPCHAWWRLCSAVWVCQFYEARYRTRCRGYPWAGDHLPYGGRGLASVDVVALW